MRPLALPLALAALLAGCNLLEPFYGEPDAVPALAEDARHARATGDYSRAVALLEKALAKEPANPTVRVELSSTLLRRDRLTLLDLERVTAHLLAAFEEVAAASSPPAAATPAFAHAAAGGEGEVCTFGVASRAEPFDPRSPDYDRIVGAGPTLRRVLELLSDPDARADTPAMPSALTRLDICAAIGESGLHYDRAGVLAAVRDRFASPEQTTAALTMNALALTLWAYLALFEQPDLPVRWFAVDGGSLGACVAEAHHDLFLARARGRVQQVGQALFSLDLLVAHTGNGDHRALVDDALALYKSIRANGMDPCIQD